MAITQRHVIMCDDVRQENNGKFIIIGIYTPDIAVTQLPFTMPSLAFVLWSESDRPGSFPFRMRLENLEAGQLVIPEAMGMMQFNKPGVGMSVIKFGGVQFARPGAYVFSIAPEGQQERLITQFSVILNIQQPPQFGGQQPNRPI